MQEKNSIDQLLLKYSHARNESLIPILQEIQDSLGFLSEEALVKVGKHIGMPTSKIYGLATFYNQFRFQPLGKYHIQVCHGSSCHILGAVRLIEVLERQLLIKSGQTTRDGIYSLEVVSCLGACAKSPVVSINGKFYSMVSEDDIKLLLEEIKSEGSSN